MQILPFQMKGSSNLTISRNYFLHGHPLLPAWCFLARYLEWSILGLSGIPKQGSVTPKSANRGQL